MQIGRTPPNARRGIQIGPKIRVGGTIGHAGQQLKIGTGKVLSNPIAQGIIGATLGPAAAAAAGGLGHALDTSHGSVGLGSIAGGGLSGYGAGQIGSAIKGTVAKTALGKSIGTKLGIGGTGAVASRGATPPPAVGVGGPMDAIDDTAGGGGTYGAGMAGGSSDGGIDWGGLAKQGLGYLTGNGGQNLLGAAQIANAAYLSKKSSDFANKAMGDVQQSYDERAPLRALGIKGLTAPTAPNTSALQGIQGSNPFAQRPLGVR